MTDSSVIEVRAKVLRVLWPKQEKDSGGREWRIVKTTECVCKGDMPWRPEAGERLRFVAPVGGKSKFGWRVSSYSGQREFEFQQVDYDLPPNERAILSYACSLTPGMGEAAAEAIWRKRGEQWREVEAGEVPRFREKEAAAFRETISRIGMHEAETAAMAFVTSLGVTRRIAEKAWEAWGQSTISIVTSDIYSLATLPGVAFDDIDCHAQMECDDPRRIRAAVRYAMGRVCAESTLTDWPALRAESLRVLRSGDAHPVCCEVRVMLKNGALHGFPSQSIARPSDFDAERDIFEFIKAATND